MKLFRLPVLVSLAGFLLLAACTRTSSAAAKPADVDYYTCTMHPSVHAQTPGKCPICSMDLVPVKNQAPPPGHDHAMIGNGPAATANAPAVENNAPHEFTIPLDRQQLIGVTF